MHAIEIDADVNADGEIHIKLPRPQQPGRARVIVLLEADRDEPPSSKGHKPSPRLAFKGAKLHGDDIEPAFSPEEWGEIYR
jgi:hypothetical protein